MDRCDSGPPAPKPYLYDYGIFVKVDKTFIVRYGFGMSNHVNMRRNSEHQKRVLELRRSNATSRHKSATDYKRKPKHPKRLTLDY